MNGLLRRLLRITYHLLYNRFSWAYDFIAGLVSNGRWNEWIMTALPYLVGPRVLELGFGTGVLQTELRRSGREVYGIETSWAMVKRAVRRGSAYDVELMLINGYAQYLPYADHTFDQIVATFPAEYIFEYRTLAEAQRTLKPGGLFLILLTAQSTSPTFIERLYATVLKLASPPQPSSLEPYFSTFRQAGFLPSLETSKSMDITIMMVKATCY